MNDLLETMPLDVIFQNGPGSGSGSVGNSTYMLRDKGYSALFFTWMAYLIVVAGIRLILCRKQPMKSRGVIPILITSIVVCRTCIDMFLLFFMDCSSSILMPISQICYFGMVFHYVKYLVAVNLQKNSKFFKTGSRKLGALRIKLLKMATSWWMTLIVLSMFVFIYGLYLMIIYLVFYYTKWNAVQDPDLFCILWLQNAWKIYALSVSCVVITTFVIAIVVDTVNNWRMLFLDRDIHSFLLVEDPYLFRLEALIYMIVIFINACLITTITAVTYSKPDMRAINPYVDSASQLFPDMLLATVVITYPVVTTIIRLLQTKFRPPPPPPDQMMRMMEIPEVHELFLNFSEAEWAAENVHLYGELVKFKGLPTLDAAQHIYSNYLVSGAPMEVNISQSIVREVKNSIDQGEITKDMFDRVQTTINTNLSDTNSRFVMTPKYTSWRRSQNDKDHLMKSFK